MTKEMLMQDQEFITYIVGLETAEEVKQAFADKGQDITDEEIAGLGALLTAATAEEGELSDEDMDSVAGGVALTTVLAVLGFGMNVYTFLKNNPEVKRAMKKGLTWAIKAVKKALR